MDLNTATKLYLYILLATKVEVIYSENYSFLRQPENQTITEGSNLTLECSVEFIPSKVQWERINGDAIEIIALLYNRNNGSWNFTIYEVNSTWHNSLVRCRVFFGGKFNNETVLISRSAQIYVLSNNHLAVYVIVGIVLGLLTVIAIVFGVVARQKWCKTKQGSVLDTSGFFYENRMLYKLNLSIGNEQLFQSIIDSYNGSEPPSLDLVLGNVLGNGYFGKVYEGKFQNENPSTTVVVKLLQDIKDEARNIEFLTEIQMNQKLISHPNILKFLGIYDCPDKIGIVLELLHRGNLKNVLRDKYASTLLEGCNEVDSKSLTREILQFAKMIGEGLEHLHHQKILHRELAARHIFVDDNNICKISDFRNSRESSEPNQYNTKTEKGFPVRWHAPEVLFYNYYTIKSEIWSYGIVLWEIVTLGATPYPRLKEAKFVVDALRGRYRMELPKHCPIDLYDIMQLCWSDDAFERPLMDILLSKLTTIQENLNISCNFHCYEHQVYQNLDSDIFLETLYNNEDKK